MSFGKAMVDAMDNGFNSGRHRWVKTSARYSIHFAPGMAPELVPAVGIASADPARARRRQGRLREAGDEVTD